MSEKPDKLPEFPPVPLHFDRWEYRGLGWKSDGPTTFAIFEEDRDTKWLEQLCPSETGGHICFHYIEAVKDPMNEGAKTGTPRTDKAKANFSAWHKRDDEAALRGSHLDSDDPKPPDGWKVARIIERDLTEALKVAGELADSVEHDGRDWVKECDRNRIVVGLDRQRFLDALAALERIRNNKH